MAKRCILGPILFGIFLSDQFLIVKYADFDIHSDDNVI